MLTDFIRDHAFTIAWFGLMAVAWFGWSQEDPPTRWRWKLGVGSVLGLTFAGVFGYALMSRWQEVTALEGRYEWFGLLVLLEVVAATAGVLYLRHKQETRWIAWWVGLVVAGHFIPLAYLLQDLSLILLGGIQAVALALIVKPMRGRPWPTSRLVGPLMGVSLLLFASVSAVVFGAIEGLPW